MEKRKIVEVNITKNNYKKQDIQFEKLLIIILIFGILVISGFIIYYLLNPEPGFHIFGILNSEKRAENYPTNASVGENVYFYCTVGNYLNRDLIFHVKVLKGNNLTQRTPEGSINAIFLYNTSKITLNHGNTWISDKLNVSFSYPGANQSIIVELWGLPPSNDEKFLNILWIQLTIFPL